MPQAWASGSLFQVLQACLGLNIDSRNALVSFDRPMLPQSLQKVELKGLSLPSGIADISFIRQGYDVVVNVQKKRGDFEVMIRK
jgi:hypothetical protein